MKDAPAISIVIPAFNEQQRLPSTIQRVEEYFTGRRTDYELIIVDDGSSDETWEIIQAAGACNPRLTGLRLVRNCGKGAAVKTGMMAARGHLVLFSDSDLSTPIEDVGLLEQAIASGAEVAIGSRGLATSQILVRQPFYRQFMGKTFNRFVRLLAVPGIADTQCGFKLFTHEASKEVFHRITIDRFGFDVEALFIAGQLHYRIAEVPVHWRDSQGSKVNPVRDSIAMFLDLLRVRANWLAGKYK